MATKDRLRLLLDRSLPSVASQSRPPQMLLLVNDGVPFSSFEQSLIESAVSPIKVVIIPNARTPGAAGAWNTGLLRLSDEAFDGFVAMLDDDDEWDAEHLQLNVATAATGQDIVVSGLRFLFDGHPVSRPLITSLLADDFLVGNPGWQGSNTFVSIHALRDVGGFRDGLPSLNDRDLAYRLLQIPSIRVAFTGKWTATWHSCSQGTLSSRRSPAKIAGLRRFWHIYGSAMSVQQSQAYFCRAKEYFGVLQHEIMVDCDEAPSQSRCRGDLNGPP
ncbi:MAG: glycosyltransferase [Phycisphaerales bacterium]|nr:glycosyltransferase [Phycisphaerales bacterium]